MSNSTQDNKTTEQSQQQPQQQQQQNPPVLEEDDEFEDFPVEGEWPVWAKGRDLAELVKLLSKLTYSHGQSESYS